MAMGTRQHNASISIFSYLLIFTLQCLHGHGYLFNYTCMHLPDLVDLLLAIKTYLNIVYKNSTNFVLVYHVPIPCECRNPGVHFPV